VEGACILLLYDLGALELVRFDTLIDWANQMMRELNN